MKRMIKANYSNDSIYIEEEDWDEFLDKVEKETALEIEDYDEDEHSYIYFVDDAGDKLRADIFEKTVYVFDGDELQYM